MAAFRYATIVSHIRFGRGTFAALAEEADRLGVERALLLTTPQQADLADRASMVLGGRKAGLFTGATMHTPVTVTAQALEIVRANGIDGLVALGGGSTIGLGKALALRTGLPQIAVPTTYAGSEMTPILGQTEHGRKTTLRDPAIQPATVLYDVDLTLGLPVSMSVTSGLNAIAHAVEALYAVDGNPVTSLMAQEGIRAFVDAMPAIVADPADIGAREAALYGAWLCGTCLGQVGMALHHKLCHTLGGMFDLPHAEMHSVILPHAIAYNSPARRAMEQIAGALGSTGDPAAAMWALATRLGAPRSLAALGMPEKGIAAAAHAAAAQPYPNPRPIDAVAIEALLRRAWAGDAPAP